eukprot:XP_017456583.1 PREDICTED: uncharacterized protein RGD1564574 [Rattus norvegicus]
MAGLLFCLRWQYCHHCCIKHALQELGLEQEAGTQPCQAACFKPGRGQPLSSHLLVGQPATVHSENCSGCFYSSSREILCPRNEDHSASAWNFRCLRMPRITFPVAARCSEELVFILVAMPSKGPLQFMQIFRCKKTATGVAHCKPGNGLIKVNGRPLEMTEPRTLQCKLLEPVLLLGKERFAGVDIRVRVKGGDHVAQIYAIRLSISKALVAY